MKTIFSLCLIAISKLVYHYFIAVIWKQKIGKKIALPDRDKLMQNRFKIVFRTEKNSVKGAVSRYWACSKL